ncbi:MAG: FAD-dependent oxidoreductase [Chromatiales bacterium]|jgi:thioredoxin reductase/NAD-dependent dihydropyrimidine dehydrogenase PreA subunit|nr:MAG: FAD-dependent oxidoreductase [Chromatiales bacterium]
MFEPLALLTYALPLMLFIVLWQRRQRRMHAASVAVLEEAVSSGLTEPASLHPLVNESLCIGCAACVAACPEMPDHKVLGMIRGKASLIGPTDCIGHGACYTACPVGAITLVLGTEHRGIDIPQVGPDFQTNVPGIFVAGELGGMGLIRNAINQGCQAIDSIRALPGIGRGRDLDVLIVGAGPAGFAASLAAMEHGLRYTTIEQDTLGGSVAHYPRGKIVMTSVATLPMVGKVRLKDTSKESLLEFWREVEADTGVRIRYGERLLSVSPEKDGFTAVTSKGSYSVRAILLAIGRRGTPQTLGVPGEDLPKTTYRLIEPEQYRDRRVLVVGGGDSAIEAACSLADAAAADVTIAYRSAAFTRAKQRNRERVQSEAAAGRVRLLLESTVTAIEPDQVRLNHSGQTVLLPNDTVIVNAGGVLPTPFLNSMGVAVERRFGTAL